MKLISLNTWGGKIYQPLMKFVKEQSATTDIFCFQEVFSTTSNIKIDHERRMNLYEEFISILGDYQGYFAPFLENSLAFNRVEVIKTTFPLYFGQAIFIKKELKVSSFGDFFLFGKRFLYDPHSVASLPRNAQYLTFSKSKQKFIIVNLHGIWLKEGKKDSPSRLKQSRIINNFLSKQKGKKIVCGDFNLDINTKSIKILEKNLKNLIKDFSVQTTRNKHFPGSDKFADYTFVSSDVNVNKFQVPQIDISDHLPMILEFS